MKWYVTKVQTIRLRGKGRREGLSSAGRRAPAVPHADSSRLLRMRRYLIYSRHQRVFHVYIESEDHIISPVVDSRRQQFETSHFGTQRAALPRIISWRAFLSTPNNYSLVFRTQLDKMADESAPLTKREFLEMSCMILGEILSPQMLRPALEAAAAKLAVPDGTALVSTLLAEKAAQAAKGKGKSKKAADNGEQKEKKKRDLTTYNLFMTWFSDFAMNYGHHPAIQKMKQDNPTLKYGVAMTGEFYRTLSEDVKVGAGGRGQGY